MLGTIIGTLASAMMGIIIFLYYFRKGQFNDIEEAKYEMFRDEQEGEAIQSFRCKTPEE